MPRIDAANLRSVALLCHSGAGKTSLCEALLFNAKVTNRLGRVEDGNTVSDYEPEEIKRRSSIKTTLVACSGNNFKVNFLDTPGYDDFLSEVICALRVVESSLILMTAQAGVDVGAERAWRQSEDQGLPRMLVVNKMDRENANFSRCVTDIQATFGKKCVPFLLPLGSAQDFKGVVSLICPPAQVPPQLADEFKAARERLVEAVAESDDTLADKYLETGELTADKVVKGARAAVMQGKLMPILACSSTQNLGVSELLEMVREFLPSPKEGRKPALKGGATSDFDANPDGPLAALVFKTTADPFVSKLSLFRVYRGTIKSNSEVWNSVRGLAERIGQLYLPRGKSQENITEASAGDIGAIGKLASTTTGDTLCARDQQVTFEPIAIPSGFYSVAVFPAGKADPDKMSMALARIVEEDPSLRFSRDSGTNETLLTGLGEAQIDVAMEKIRRKFGADLKVRLPKIPYKETISQVTKIEHRHKKQSGGHGQYGHVVLRLEPLGRDQGFKFTSEIVGGKVPRSSCPRWKRA